MIDLTENQIEKIKSILEANVPGARVLAFGSRATRNARKHSDLDIAIIADEEIPFRVLGKLTFDFEESDLPFNVDVSDWSVLDTEFRESIEKQCEVLWEG
ncbi:MAG: nucleotidyltransferase domain-containing protein [Planctomycetes bacterium]|nr:nucleotidyltransferase domain-containing protein [Planctomycetota bacterium]